MSRERNKANQVWATRPLPTAVPLPLPSLPHLESTGSKHSQLGGPPSQTQTFTQDSAYHGKAANCLLKQFPFLVAQSLAKGSEETKSYDSALENSVPTVEHTAVTLVPRFLLSVEHCILIKVIYRY